MAGHLHIRVYERQQPVYTEDFTGPVELGRQSDANEQPYSKRLDNGRWRAVIARLNEDTISRKHVLLEPLGTGRLRLTNLSSNVPVHYPEGDLTPEQSCEVMLPIVLTLGRRTTIHIDSADMVSAELQHLPDAVTPPGIRSDPSSHFATLAAPTGSIEPEALIRWLNAMMGVLQSAASSSNFFAQAAQAMVDHVGLNTGRVLLLEGGTWKTAALASAPRITLEPNWQPSQKVLHRLVSEKRTFWQVPGQQGIEAGSLVGVKAVVAAPILDRQGEVIGALYGDRRQDSRSAFAPPISRIHALLVELLAGGVAAGLARVEQEQAALAARVQFEQFFTPELSRQLAAEPDLLKGRDCEVTILFADIRGFSRISERLGPAATDEWIRDVMENLSDCVLAHRGVLVDYIGDEVMAMWGAPESQPDHARLACRAALDMLERLPQLNTRWTPVLGEPVALGIGVNTGQARVGNTGSQRKFKYGPLGTTVNVASRVQGATKYLKSSLLVTESTHGQLGADFSTRRLGRVHVVNIAEPVVLYEVAATGQPNWMALQQGYEKALEEFEHCDFRKTVRILGNLLALSPGDGPSLVLLSRAITCLIEESTHVDTVWKMPGK